MFISYIICLSFYPSHTLSFSHCYIHTYTSSISTSSSSSSSVGTCRYGLSGAGWNLYPVMTKNTRVASSLNNSSSHSYWKGTVIYKDIGRVQLFTKTLEGYSYLQRHWKGIVIYKDNEQNMLTNYVFTSHDLSRI